jgi:ribosomal protein L7/L12
MARTTDTLIDALTSAHETIGSLRTRLDAALDRVDELSKPAPTSAFSPDGSRIWPDLAPDQVAAEVRNLLDALSHDYPRKINAIRQVRLLTRCSLKQAKDLVETVMPPRPYPPIPAPTYVVSPTLADPDLSF